MTDLDPRTHARRSDPDTSHDAAARLGDQRSLMGKLLVVFLDGDRTAEQASLSLGLVPERANKRVSDLSNLGLIEDTGERRVGRAGRNQIVWTITRAGVVWLSNPTPTTKGKTP